MHKFVMQMMYIFSLFPLLNNFLAPLSIFAHIHNLADYILYFKRNCISTKICSCVVELIECLLCCCKRYEFIIFYWEFKSIVFF